MPRGSDPNRCQASEVEPLAVARTRRGAAPPSPPAAQIIRPHQEPEEEAAEGEDEVSRLFDDDAKMDIFNKYAAWIKAGKIPADSPIDDLVNEHGCDRTYPSKLYKKVMKNGTIDNQWAGGRPPIYSANAREQVVGKIREAVKRAWGKVTDEMCVAVSKRVRINMANVIKLKGGNFYTEGKAMK